MERYQEDSAETRRWLWVGSVVCLSGGGGLFMAGSLWPLVGIVAIALGLATLIVTGGGNYFKSLPPGRKVIAAPGLVIGCVAMGVAIAFVQVVLPILKRDLME